MQPNWNWTGFYLNWFEQKINARFYKTSLVNWILYTKLVQLTELVFAGIKFLLLEKPSLKLIPFFWKTQFEISVVLRTCLKLVQNQFGSKPFIKTSPVLSRFSKPIRLFEYKTDLIDSEPWNWTGFYLNWFEQKINARFYKTSLVNWILYTKLVQLTELVFAGIKFLLLEKPSLKLIPFFWKTQFEISVVLRTCLKLVQNQFGSKPFIKTSPVLSRFSKPIRLFEYKTDLIDSEPVRFDFFTEPVFAHP